jgi:formylglycine-generating enzyme required for sulfatase activity
MSGPMPPQLRALLDAIPEDPLAAFALADYLEEQGDHRGRLQGELLRLAYALTRSARVRARKVREQRLRALLSDGVRAIGPYRRVEVVQGVVIEFAWVPPGTFLMGSPVREKGRDDEERRHQVTLTRGFWMGTTQVTWGQSLYKRMLGRDLDPGLYAGWDPHHANRPVDEVTWDDAVTYCAWLAELPGSKAAGLAFRLPTEAEWEYACRAGTTTRFWSGDGDGDLERVAWCRETSSTDDGYGPHVRAVGEKPGNAWGLCEMHGNVWEWCHDWYEPDAYTDRAVSDPRFERPSTWDRRVSERRVIRGGGAYTHAENCRSSTRHEFTPDCSHNDLGFRVVADRL